MKLLGVITSVIILQMNTNFPIVTSIHTLVEGGAHLPYAPPLLQEASKSTPVPTLRPADHNHNKKSNESPARVVLQARPFTNRRNGKGSVW